MRLYSDLASWFHLLTSPADYAGEAARYRSLIDAACPGARTLLELGSGGGNNASHLREHYAVLVSEPGHPARFVHDHQLEGLFPEHTWLYLLEQAGFDARVVPGDPDDEDAEQPVFIGVRPAA